MTQVFRVCSLTFCYASLYKAMTQNVYMLSLFRQIKTILLEIINQINRILTLLFVSERKKQTKHTNQH